MRNVLSLFDGISCGQLALCRADIAYDRYFASEIDPTAISITMRHFPNTIQLGDVKNIKGSDLPEIYLLMGGSPCQDLSISKRDRQGLNGERSGLFWDFLRLLHETKPQYFLLENVALMPKKDKNIITKELGIEPILINSALVSAQNRERLYWTNIPNVRQPINKHIHLSDILELGNTEKLKSYCVNAKYFLNKTSMQNYCSTAVKDLLPNQPIRIGSINKGGQGERIYDINGKSVCLNANGGGRGAKTGLYKIGEFVRKLTPLECERLQTLPDNYTEYGVDADGRLTKISDNKRYQVIGNGWTVDVIAHILKNLINADHQPQQPIKLPNSCELIDSCKMYPLCLMCPKNF